MLDMVLIIGGTAAAGLVLIWLATVLLAPWHN